MPNDRPHYGPSPSRRKKIDELWMRQEEEARTQATSVVTSSLNGIVAQDGTIAPSALPLSNTEPPAVAFGGGGTAGVSPAASRDDHTHDGPTDPVPAHEAASNPHPGYLSPADLAALFLAKGDILVGTGAGTYARLPAPTTAGGTLVSDPTTTTGLRWAPNATATPSLLTLAVSLSAPTRTASATPTLRTATLSLSAPTITAIRRATVTPAMVTLAVSLRAPTVTT